MRLPRCGGIASVRRRRGRVLTGVARRLRAAGRILRRPYYLTRPRLWGDPLSIVDARTMVSHAGRYVYLRVPKAANSTVVRTLLEHRAEPGVALDDLDLAKTQVTHFSDVGFEDLRALQSYFVFTVVRDPYARTLSAYLDKFRDGDKHLDRFGARIAAMDDGAISFLGFCRYLAAGGEAENAHWMRQTRLTRLADRVDFTGRVESLDADLGRILTRIGGRTPGRLTRAGPPATGAAERLRAYYGVESQHLVETVYRADFSTFGYPFWGI